MFRVLCRTYIWCHRCSSCRTCIWCYMCLSCRTCMSCAYACRYVRAYAAAGAFRGVRASVATCAFLVALPVNFIACTWHSLSFFSDRASVLCETPPRKIRCLANQVSFVYMCAHAHLVESSCFLRQRGMHVCVCPDSFIYYYFQHCMCVCACARVCVCVCVPRTSYITASSSTCVNVCGVCFHVVALAVHVRIYTSAR